MLMRITPGAYDDNGIFLATPGDQWRLELVINVRYVITLRTLMTSRDKIMARQPRPCTDPYCRGSCIAAGVT